MRSDDGLNNEAVTIKIGDAIQYEIGLLCELSHGNWVAYHRGKRLGQFGDKPFALDCILACEAGVVTAK